MSTGGSSNQYSYGLGATQLAVGLSSTIMVTPPPVCKDMLISYVSGGTLCMVAGASQIYSQGVPLTSTLVSTDGPARFWLAAAGSTSICGIIFKYAAGFSTL